MLNKNRDRIIKVTLTFLFFIVFCSFSVISTAPIDIVSRGGQSVSVVTTTLNNTQKGTNDIFLYNDSLFIFFNDTLLNLTIDDKVIADTDTNASTECAAGEYLDGDADCINLNTTINYFANNTWNQTLAESLFAPLLYGDDWNKTYADTLYTNITFNYNQTESQYFYNMTDHKYFYNQTTGAVTISNAYTDTVNTTSNIEALGFTQGVHTTDTNASTECAAGEYLDGDTDCIDLNATIDFISNSTWNQTLADSLYANITFNYNQTESKFFYNQTVIDGSDNESWNQTFASTLYANITFNYNQTESRYFYNQTDHLYFYNQTTGAVTISNAYTDTVNTTANIESLGFVQGAHTTDTNASTECSAGEYLDGDATCINLNDTIDAIFVDEEVVYNATSIVTETGTLDSGDINSVLILGDGDTYNVSEVSGAPGFLINVTFTNVTNFNTVAIRGMYDGGAGHTIDLELFRLTTQTWDDFGDITDQPDIGVTSFPVFVGADFINTSVGNGTVLFRFNHDDSGINSHDYILDAIFIGQVTGLVSGGGHDDTTGRDNTDNHPWAMDTNATRNFTNNLFGDLEVNATFNWFFGLFDWVESSEYATFNGSTLVIDDATLNTVFNQTALIDTVNATSNIEALGFTQGVHTTDTNASVCGVSEYLDGDGTCINLNTTINFFTNTTWNQTLGDSLYANITFNYNQTESKFFYNMTVIDGAGNLSWNQTFANTLFANITFNYNQTESKYFYNMTESKFFYNMTVIDGAGNLSWNQTFANTLFANITFNYNQTDSKYFYNQTESQYFYNMTDHKYFYNQTDHKYFYNQTVITAAGDHDVYINETGDVMTGNLNMTESNITINDGSTSFSEFYDNGTCAIWLRGDSQIALCD